MEIRGRRACKECGNEWSYYDTGSVTCPNCGSLRSVGVDEDRKRHTATTETLDLTAVREQVDVEPLHRVAEAAAEEARPYVRQLGYIRAGELLDLDDGSLAAHELLHVADVVGRSFDPTDAEEFYLLELLRGADQEERPAVDAVPDSMRAARGLAYADAVRDYRRELRTWFRDRPDDPTVADALERLDDHDKRIRMLQGDVSPRTAETLVEAARDLATYARDGDETAMSRLESRFDRLADV